MKKTPKYRWAMRTIDAVIQRSNGRPDEEEIIMTQEEADAFLYALDLYEQGALAIPWTHGQLESARQWRAQLFAERKELGLPRRWKWQYESR